MDRRLHLQQRVPLELVERGEMLRRIGPAQFRAARKMEDLTAEAPVAQQRADVVVSGKAPMTILLPFERRRFLMKPEVEGIRILAELR